MSTAPGVVGSDVRILIHGLAAGGDGIGKDETGRATFVAGTVPGEVVRARLVEIHARWARGTLVSIDTSSPARVAPACRLFETNACGGCQWQHVTIDAQREAKQQILAGALRRMINSGMQLRPLVTPVPDLYWRRRVRCAVTDGAVGFRAPRSHIVSDIASVCVQVEPALGAVLQAVRTQGAIASGAAGELHVVVRSGGAHVVLDVPCDPVAAAKLLGQAGIVGVAWNGGAIGSDAVELEPGLWVRADDFAQASLPGNFALRQLVRDACAAAAGTRVLELHAGSGNFTRDLALAGADVTAVDERAPARPVGEFITGRAAEVVERLASSGSRFEVILLDPPRTGERDAIRGLAALAPKRVVYVSCDPATFARDADALIANGLRPRWAQGLDLMPQTAHVELVACFEPT